MKWFKRLFSKGKQKVYRVYFKYNNEEISFIVKDISKEHAKEQALIYVKKYAYTPSDYQFLKCEEV